MSFKVSVTLAVFATVLSLLASALPNNLLLTGGSITGCLNNKHMALTFDDGPSTYTPELLKVLRKHDVKATFFQLGVNVKTFPEFTQQIYDEGHLIGSHTYTHKNLAITDTDTIISEIYRADQLFKEVIGKVPVFFRYPFGRYNERTDTISQNMGKVSIDWNIDTNDQEFARRDPSRISSDFPDLISWFATHEGVISLFHSEMYPESITAVEEVISWALSNGYKFVTVDECIGYNGNLYTEDIPYDALALREEGVAAKLTKWVSSQWDWYIKPFYSVNEQMVKVE